jgi:hypothetical protein
MEVINITAYPTDNSQVEAIKAVLKALKIQFEMTKEKPYNPEFVAKIKKSKQDYKEGKGRTVTIDELNALWK